MLAACAANDEPQPALPPESEESLLPGTIGVIVHGAPAGVVVASVGQRSPAAGAGVKKGDTILRYNGMAVSSAREFNRLVLDSRPGSVARLELLREGAIHRVEVPVRQLDTTLRG